MTVFARWWPFRRAGRYALYNVAWDSREILLALHRKVDGLMANLDDIKNNQAKEKALIEKLLGLVTAVPAGTFTPEQQAEIDGIVADQQATLAEDTTAPQG